MRTITERISLEWRSPAAHALFWGGVFAFFVFYFGREADGYRQSLLFVALLLPVAMATIYFLTRVLVPRYLLPGRYGRFALYAAYTIVASVYLELVVLVTSFVFLAGYEIRAMNPATLDVFGLVIALYVVVLVALSIDLFARWSRLNAAHAEAERARLEAELRLREAELARLKLQMHPHFLFNTLNNLYGLTLEGPKNAPDVVLRLADLLDYVLYRCDRPFVPLAAEIEHLRTYLELERLRYDERVEISFSAGEAPPGASIAPLLLVPFVENAFKHGAAGGPGPVWVRIELAAGDGSLSFSVENSVNGGMGADHARKGVGLENVRRRLDLLYPDAHELVIDDAPDRYSVRIRLPLRQLKDPALHEMSYRR